MMDIEGLDKAEILAALYNAAGCGPGLAAIRYRPNHEMTPTEAEQMLSTSTYFDYVHGRVLKVNLAEDVADLRVDLYDRDNGFGAAARALQPLKEA